jgi:hypothetical protein
MRIVVAVLLGLFSGFLVYMETAMLLSSGGSPGGALVAFTFLGGAGLCTYLMLKGATSTTKVIARGSLIGAALWLFMIVAGTVLSGRAVSDTMATAGSDAGKAGAVIGGGLTAFLAGAVSIVMTIVCLLSFVVFYLLGRELKQEVTDGPTKKGPQCDETVKAEARKCKHCGAEIGTLAAAGA